MTGTAATATTPPRKAATYRLSMHTIDYIRALARVSSTRTTASDVVEEAVNRMVAGMSRELQGELETMIENWKTGRGEGVAEEEQPTLAPSSPPHALSAPTNRSRTLS